MFKVRLFVLLVLVVLLALPLVARAQESTAEPGSAVTAVPDGGEVTIVQETPDWQSLVNYTLPVLSALFGLLAGGGGVFVVLNRANQDKQLKDSTEQLLYKSTPPETINLIHQLALGLKGGAEFLASVTDGQPNG